jgi:hypothetical protein
MKTGFYFFFLRLDFIRYVNLRKFMYVIRVTNTESSTVQKIFMTRFFSLVFWHVININDVILSVVFQLEASKE